MADKKSFFTRALDSLVESRMRQAQHELAQYHQMFGADLPTKSK